MSATKGLVNPVLAEIIDSQPTDPQRLVRYMERELEAIKANPQGLWRDMDQRDVDVARVWLEQWIEKNA